FGRYSVYQSAGRIWQAPRLRNREVGQGDPGGEHQAGVAVPRRMFRNARSANRGALMSTSRPRGQGLTSQKLRAVACPIGSLMVIQTLPTKPAVCTNYCIV